MLNTVHCKANTGHAWNTFVLLVVMLSSLVSGCSKSLTENDYIERAKQLQDKGNFRDSVIELKNALLKEPNSPQANLMLAEALLSLGNPNLAEISLKKARQAGVSVEATRVLMARTLLLQGRLDQAIRETEATPNTAPAISIQLMDIKAQILMAQHHVEESCALFEKIKKKQEDSIPAALGLALCSMQLAKDNSRAEAIVREVVKKDPNNAKAWTMLGDLARIQNRQDEAENAYKTAIEKDPMLFAPRSMLTILYLKENKLNQAQQQAESAAKASPTPQAAYLVAMVDYRRGNNASARDKLNAILKDNPNYMAAVGLSGAVASALGNHELAVKRLARYLESKPEDVLTRKLLIISQLRLGQVKKAVETLKPLLEQSTQQDPGVFALAGDVYLRAGKSEHAINYLERAITLAPNNGSIRAQLGYTLLTSGKADRAVLELKKAAETDVNDAKADTILSNYYLSQREFDQALTAIEGLTKKLPEKPLAYLLRGLALAGKNDLVGARTSFEQALKLDPHHKVANYNLAKIDILENKLDAARKLYESILADHSGDLEAMLGLANLASMEKNDKSYLEWLEKAAKTNPNAQQPRILLVDYYQDKNDSKHALFAAQSAQIDNQSSPWALELLGRTQIAIGENESALTSFSKLAQAEPDSAAAHYQLGLLQAALNRRDAAAESLKKAQALAPNNLPASEALAMLELSRGKSNEAMQVAKNIKQQAPQSYAPYVLEGDLYVYQKLFRQAAIAYDKALDLNSYPLLLHKWHRAMLLDGKARQADKRLHEWIDDHPDDTVTQSYFASSLLQRKLYKDAEKEYELLVQRDPKKSPFLTNLAWLYQQLGDPRALTTAERAYKMSPESVATTDILGWLLVQAGQMDKGLPLLQKAAEKGGVSPSITYHYAYALAKSGDKNKARDMLNKIMQSDVEFLEKDDARKLLEGL